MGTVGLVKSVGKASLVLKQVPLAPTHSAGPGPISTVTDVPQVGSFARPLVVTVGQGTSFSDPGGLAGLLPGTLIAVTGHSSGGRLTAASVGVLLTSRTVATRRAAAGRLPAYAGPAHGAQAHRAATQSLGADDTRAFARIITNLGPALKYDTPAVVVREPVSACYDVVGRKVAGAGEWTATIVPQAILSLGGLRANYPFDVTYDPMPASYQTTSGGTFSLGPVPDWLNFIALDGTDSTPTLELTAGASLGVQLTIGNTCPGNLPPITIAAATLGYSIDSATTKPMPGGRTKIMLAAKSCIGLNEPLNINLFVDPVTGRPDLNPFGNFTVANLSFCDQPTVTGNLVTANVANLAGARINQPTMTFDPAKVGPASVESWGTITPTAPRTSFTLGDFAYHPGYIDGYRLVYTVLGQPVLSTPPVSPFQGHVSFNGLKAADAPVGLTSTPQPVITHATFDVPSASWNPTDGVGGSWNVNVNWNITWDSTSQPISLPLVVGKYQYAGRADTKGGGTYSYTTSNRSCTDGTLSLANADSPFDAEISVVGATETGAQAVWTLRVQASGGGHFSSSGSNCAPPPPFGDTTQNGNNHPFEATVTLKATGQTTPHTQSFTVSPVNPGEQWSGTVTLTGVW